MLAIDMLDLIKYLFLLSNSLYCSLCDYVECILLQTNACIYDSAIVVVPIISFVFFNKSVSTILQEIHQVLTSLNVSGLEVTKLNCQDSMNGGILLIVQGVMRSRNFSGKRRFDGILGRAEYFQALPGPLQSDRFTESNALSC